MARLSILSLLLALALPLARVNAFWILGHHPLVSERLDRIVSPGVPSGHVHNFVGSAAININQDPDDYCTTSPVKADLSNYWTPQLYYYHGDSATFSSVPLSGVNTYYLNRGGPIMGENASSLRAFPLGLKMLAGQANAYDGPISDPTAAKAISFVCLNYTGEAGTSPQTTTLPSGPCLDGMRLQVIFPSCWDGVNLDSATHESHVSYPIDGQPDTSDCPSSHPVKFMTLFYEFIYNTGSLASISNGTNSSGFVLANGDAVGYSFHGDFISGWNTTILTDAITACSGNLFGDLDSCPPFVSSLHYETTTPDSDADAGYCTTKSAVNEKVLGTGFTALPNCQVVRNGPFKGAGNCTETSTPTISQISNSTSPNVTDYQGCYEEPTGARALTYRATSVAASNMTTAGCQAACTAADYTVAGLEYAEECWCGNSFTHGTTKLKDEFCNMACTGNSTEMCGGSNILSVYSSGAVVTLATPVIPTTAGNASYWGCYKEKSNARLLSGASYANSSNTPTLCAAYCTVKGYPFSGTEYSDECYCGTKSNMANATLMADSSCNMVCSGNSTAYCGGSSRLQIYSALTNPNATTTSSSSASTATTSVLANAAGVKLSITSTSTPKSSSISSSLRSSTKSSSTKITSTKKTSSTKKASSTKKTSSTKKASSTKKTSSTKKASSSHKRARSLPTRLGHS